MTTQIQIRTPCLAASVLCLISWLVVSVFSSVPLRAADSERCRPTLEWTLETGKIVRSELFPEAGPEIYRRLVELADPRGLQLELEQVDPHGRVVTSPIPLLEDLPLQINGNSLGLDRLTVEDSGQAMELMQRTLLPVHTRNKQAPPTERFAQWIDQWRRDRKPGFLIGVSRMEILQALGSEFTDQVVSYPVERGSLVLMPATATTVRPQLVVVLLDRPDRNGRWQVIGRVTRGLEQLREISIRPLARATAKRGPLQQPVRVSLSLDLPASEQGLGCR